MHTLLKTLLAVAGVALATTAGAQVKLYSGPGFHGQEFYVDHPMRDLDRTDFNDRASSLIVEHGRWQVCEDSHFQGRCVTLRPGEYPSLNRMGMDNKISSIRPVEQYGRADEYRYDRPWDRNYEYRR
jgi:hypothetical protein